MQAGDFDREMSGVLAEFEQDFDRRCRERGLSGGKILSSEQSIVKAFVLFLHGKGRHE